MKISQNDTISEISGKPTFLKTLIALEILLHFFFFFYTLNANFEKFFVLFF